MNIVEMVDEVRSNAHELDTTFLSDDEIVKFINRGQRRAQLILAKDYEEFFHYTSNMDLVAQQSEYDIPDDCFANRIQNIDILYNTDLYHVDPISLNRTHNVYYSSPTFVPTHFMIKANKIVLFPTPSTGRSEAMQVTYTKRLSDLGKSQGEVESSTSTTIVVDDLGGDLVAGAYISVCDPVNATIRGSYQIDSIDNTTRTVTIEASPTLSTYRGRTITGSISGVSNEDLVILAAGTAVPELSIDYHDFLVYYATVEVLKKAKEPIEEAYATLKEAEEHLKAAWQDRLSFETVKITKETLDYGD